MKKHGNFESMHVYLVDNFEEISHRTTTTTKTQRLRKRNSMKSGKQLQTLRNSQRESGKGGQGKLSQVSRRASSGLPGYMKWEAPWKSKTSLKRRHCKIAPTPTERSPFMLSTKSHTEGQEITMHQACFIVPSSPTTSPLAIPPVIRRCETLVSK